MTGLSLGLVVEISVAVLLMMTIGYCIVLNDRLKKLHADRDALRQMVADLVQATDLANSAIKGLREAANEADSMLSGRLNEADRFAVELANHVNAGRTIMDRIARVTDAARKGQAAPAPAAPVSTATNTAKGAQAALDRLAAHQRQRESAA